ncbi:MAG: hypothetical protein PHC88_15610 [Terrimicrobiaceae bacterium]|nr:hypothetical protein [Terrimicrobiaceae bacterium]
MGCGAHGERSKPPDIVQGEQQALGMELSALHTEGATPQQLKEWRARNAARFAAQQQRVREMADASALEPMAAVAQPNIPADASPTLRDFLTRQAALANARAQVHNQLLGALPMEVTEAQLREMQQKEAQLFAQQHAGDLKAQSQRARALGEESARTPLAAPGPTEIPQNATLQLQAFLTQRDQLMRERIALWNQTLNADPAARDSALRQLCRQNAARIGQLHALTRSLTIPEPPRQFTHPPLPGE